MLFFDLLNMRDTLVALLMCIIWLHVGFNEFLVLIGWNFMNWIALCVLIN